MNQTIHVITPTLSSSPESAAASLPTKQDRLERARALVIAQFGARVLIDQQNARSPRSQ